MWAWPNGIICAPSTPPGWKHLPSTGVGELPEGEKPPVDISPWTHAQESRRQLGDGICGGAYRARDAGMMELLDGAMAPGPEAPDRLKAPK